MTKFAIPGIPGEFQWLVPAVEWGLDTESGLSMTAGPWSDLFNDPTGKKPMNNAPRALMTSPDSSFIFSAKVAVEFASTFDAGCLQVRANEDHWAKLCFEYSPQGQPMVVSVVTRDVSDDCNSAEIDCAEIFLRIARTPKRLAFHYSLDGLFWHFVRHFSLGQSTDMQMGFSVQSPRGEKCRAVFTHISYRAGELKDLRTGE